MFLPEAEKRIAKLVFIAGNIMSSAHVMNNSLLCLTFGYPRPGNRETNWWTLKESCFRFLEMMLLPEAEKRIAKLVCIAWLCYSVSGNIMSSAHVMKSSLICLLACEYPPFVTSFVLSSEDQETGKRIGLNSHRCSCEELTRKYTGTDRIVKLFTL